MNEVYLNREVEQLQGKVPHCAVLAVSHRALTVPTMRTISVDSLCWQFSLCLLCSLHHCLSLCSCSAHSLYLQVLELSESLAKKKSKVAVLKQEQQQMIDRVSKQENGWQRSTEETLQQVPKPSLCLAVSTRALLCPHCVSLCPHCASWCPHCVSLCPHCASLCLIVPPLYLSLCLIVPSLSQIVCHNV